jgi:hypothetical protein
VASVAAAPRQRLPLGLTIRYRLAPPQAVSRLPTGYSTCVVHWQTQAGPGHGLGTGYVRVIVVYCTVQYHTSTVLCAPAGSGGCSAVILSGHADGPVPLLVELDPPKYLLYHTALYSFILYRALFCVRLLDLLAFITPSR